MARRTTETAATATETANDAQAATTPATAAPTAQTAPTAPTINIFNERQKPATRKRTPRRTRFDEDDDDELETRAPAPAPVIIREALTDDEGDENDEPRDPFTEFVDEFRDYQGTVSITRLVDPMYMREAARIGRHDAPNFPCVEPIPYPRFPFNVDTFMSDVLMLTGSGGRYRVQLHNTRGHYERGSAWTGIIPNLKSIIASSSPAQTLPAATAPAPQPLPEKPAPTPEAKPDLLQEAINEAVRKKISTLFDPPATPTPEKPAPTPEAKPDPIREAIDEAYKKKIVDFVSGVTSGGSGDAPASNFDRVINLVERNPSIIRSLDSKVNRVLDYFVPGSAGDGDEETTPLADQVLDLARERCAANEPLAFDDPLLVEMREREPSQYEDLIFNLNNGSVEQIAETFTQIDEAFALVMKAPHSRAWIEGLKELAASAAKQLEAAK